ncbi:MAG TPA: type II toxin-antitoxin system death-on-curing family toxin [Pyrinomonadaceae bacterium]
MFDRALLQSSLARPQHASKYAQSDLAAQAATLCYGLIKNHPWVGGNKRTATHLTDHFLRINGSEIIATTDEMVNMVNDVDSGTTDLAGLTEWMRNHVKTPD